MNPDVFLDSHCHLDKLKLDHFDHDLDKAIAAARERDVHRILCIGIGLDNLDEVVAIAQRHPDVYASVGIHPSEYERAEVTHCLDTILARLQVLAADSKVVAIGETGLDFFHSTEAKTAQRESFNAHLALAKQLQLPVVVHTRSAQRETLDAIRAADSPSSGVLHCFTEEWDMAREALDMGYYVSISGIVTFRNADNVREVAARVPLDRMLLETDAPWLAPVPHRGRPNLPSYVVDVYHAVAELRGIPVDELATAVWDNFHRLFRRCPAHSAH